MRARCYAIVPAVFRPNWRTYFSGSAHIANTEIQLPLRWHALFNNAINPAENKKYNRYSYDSEENRATFTAQLAFGARLEPWIANLQAQPPVL